MSEKLQKYRFLERFLPTVHEKKLVILTGARQTGKTTLVRLKYPELNYINLDAPENREFVRLVSSVNWGRDVGTAIIDEAQKEPVVFDKIKYAFDAGNISFTLILGSSQILLLKKVRESLAGRVAMYELWPLLMSELCWDKVGKNNELPLVDKLFSDEKIDDIFTNVSSVRQEESDSLCRDAENHLLQWGGMPSLLFLKPEERWKWLRDYEYTYLERDLCDLARLDDLEPFRKFQRLSSLRSARLLNYSELARDASVSVDTARRYLEYLRLSYQVILLQPYYRNITTSVVKTPKLFWLDVGIMRQLSGYRGPLSTGEIYETMVVGELTKWMKTLQRDGEIYFYRTRSGLEVDIILQTSHGIVGMEVKERDKVFPQDIKALKELAEHLRSEWRGGILIYRGNEIKKIADSNIWAVPSRRLFI